MSEGWPPQRRNPRSGYLALKPGPSGADSKPVELPHPLPEPADEEPRLELVPEPEETEAAVEAVEEDAEPVALDEPAEASTSDPLRLYVRQIGDGPLLTR